MAVSGDFMRLRLLQERLKAAARGEACKAVIGSLRDESVKQVVDCFNQKRDPYGRAWPARKKATGWAAMAFGAMENSHPLLDKTGRLIASVRAVATTTGVKVTMLGYGVYHWQPDRPGSRLPQRAMLPTKRQGLGQIWGDAYLKRSGEVMRSFMRAA